MRFPGRIYQGERGTYLALYNYHPDIFMACPDSLKGNAERVGHVTYAWAGYKRAVDVFRLKEEVKRIAEIRLRHKLTLDKTWERTGDVRQDIRYELLRNTPTEVKDLVRADVKEFVMTKKKNPPAKNHERVVRTTYKQRIVSETGIKLIRPSKKGILTPGKQEFVPQCGNYANIDFTKGCVSSLVVDAEDELGFGPAVVRGVYVAPWLECSYCYAQNKHKPALKTVFNIDWNQVKEELLGKAKLTTGSDEEYGRRVERLRFGKRTEAASRFTRPQFMKTLELCVETGTQGVIPTKFLEYNQEVAELLKRTSSVVLYSIGWDSFEKGAVSQGCTNEWRLEQAAKYAEAGIKTAIYMMIADPVIGPNERDKRIIEFAEKNKKNLAGVQLLPMRFKSKELAINVAGVHWNDAKSNMLLIAPIDPHIGAYEVIGGELNPREFHPFWLQLIGNNNDFYRMCHHTNEHVWCGGCFTRNGFDINHKRVPVNAVKKIPRPASRRDKKKKLLPAAKRHQMDLF